MVKYRQLILLIFLLLVQSRVTAQYYESIDTLWSRLNRTSNPRERYMIYDGIGINLYYHYGYADTQILAICQKMVKIGEQLDNDSLLSRAYLLMDVYYGYSGNNRLVLKYVREAIDHAKKAKYWDGLSAAYKEHAILYKDLGAYDKALNELKKSEKCLSNAPDQLNYMQPNRLYYNMADVYYRMDSNTAAMNCIDKAKKLTDVVKDPYGYARVLDMYGKIYAKRNELPIAESFFKQAIQQCKDTRLYYPLVVITNDYCDLLIRMNKLEEAKIYATEGLRYALYINNKYRTVDLMEVLKRVYQLSGSSESMYHYAWICDSLRTIADSEHIFSQIINSVRDDENDERKDEKLQEEQQLKVEYVALTIAVVLAVILFLSLSQTIVVNKKMIRLLTNIAFLMFFELLNILIHLIVHDWKPYWMFLLLVGIAAILLPLHHSLQEKITAKLVKNNETIRLRAAKKTLEELGQQ